MSAQELSTLSFHDTNLEIIDRNGQQWLQGNQIAAALGYKRSDAVTKIFDRNSDEFTDNMTAVTKLGVVRNQGGTIDLPNLGKQRIFSPRGAHQR